MVALGHLDQHHGPMAQSAETRGRGFDRLVNFSDAVVAIAITLLVLPMVDSVSGEATGSARSLLEDNGSRLFAFALSFAVIATFWLAHHRLFETIGGYTGPLLWANMAWLLSIVFLPFPTEMVGVHGTDDALVRFLYIATVLVTAATLMTIEVIVTRTPTIWIDPDGVDVDLVGGFANLTALTVALVVGVAVPAIGMWALLLRLAEPLVTRMVRGRFTSGASH
jgi:uncharacterized membrane protein